MGLEWTLNRQLGGILMEMWGSRIKLPKLAENMFNNQQGLKATKKALGGGVDGG